MTTNTLETPRLRLTGVSPAYIHEFYNTRSKEEIIRHFGFGEGGYEKYKIMHEKGMQTYNMSFYFFLLVNKETGLPIGQCGFHSWNSNHHRAEVFYHLESDADKQRGFMTEALPVVLKYGFEEMKLHRIEAFIGDFNTPSKKLLLNHGFVKEGTAREHYLINGVHEDSDFYSLIKKK